MRCEVAIKLEQNQLGGTCKCWMSNIKVTSIQCGIRNESQFEFKSLHSISPVCLFHLDPFLSHTHTHIYIFSRNCSQKAGIFGGIVYCCENVWFGLRKPLKHWYPWVIWINLICSTNSNSIHNMRIEYSLLKFQSSGKLYWWLIRIWNLSGCHHYMPCGL